MRKACVSQWALAVVVVVVKFAPLPRRSQCIQAHRRRQTTASQSARLSATYRCGRCVHYTHGAHELYRCRASERLAGWRASTSLIKFPYTCSLISADRSSKSRAIGSPRAKAVRTTRRQQLEEPSTCRCRRAGHLLVQSAEGIGPKLSSSRSRARNRSNSSSGQLDK